jgi:hypothetical protein
METTDLETGVDPFDQLMGAIGDDEAEATGTAGEEEALAEPERAATDETEPAEEAPQLVDIDGKKLEIPQGTPPALVEGVTKLAADLKADYTKKTQEVAEQRKAIEQKSEAIQAQHKLLSANLEKTAELRAIQERLTQFEQVDWDQLAEADPVQATKLNLAYQKLQRQAQQTYGSLQEGQAQQQQIEREQRAKALEEARVDLKRRIPNWNAEIDKAVTKTGEDLGFTPKELGTLSDPRVIQALHEAAQWRQLQAAKPKALQKVVEAPRVLKPGAAEQRKPNQAAIDRHRKHGSLDTLAALIN